MEIAHTKKNHLKQYKAASDNSSEKYIGGEIEPRFTDNRPTAILQRRMQETANNSEQVQKAAQLSAMVNKHSSQQKTAIPRKENRTGLPTQLKLGIEALSGFQLDDVKVHYQSNKPAQFQAYAYAQGTDIHVAPGQEKHLAHEAWHVVQQKQGRVKPTFQMKGIDINDNESLESEADEMGIRALQYTGNNSTSPSVISGSPASLIQAKVIQLLNSGQKKVLNKLKGKLSDATPKDQEDCWNRIKAELDTLNAGTEKNILDGAKYLKVTAKKPNDEEKREALDSPDIVYGAEHGDLHFGGNPTPKKSKWSLEKEASLTLMEDEINKYLEVLGKHSGSNENDKGWSPFYITAQHESSCGAYFVPKNERKQNNFPTTDHFTIQLQVNYKQNSISYHGFPDEKIEGHALGCSINKTDKNKLE